MRKFLFIQLLSCVALLFFIGCNSSDSPLAVDEDDNTNPALASLNKSSVHADKKSRTHVIGFGRALSADFVAYVGHDGVT